MSKVELYERIRKDYERNQWGVRRLAKEHHVHRREVRQALASAAPVESAVTRRRPALGPWLATIDAILAGDRQAPRKQRHTAHRIYTRLVNEWSAKVGEPTVRRYVRERKRELFGMVEAMVPQMHEAGEEAEVDLYEAVIDFGAGEETVDFFVMRACHSGSSFHWPLRVVDQQAFLEAHAEGFAHFGGPFRTMRYDNLKQAVRKILRGRDREQSERFKLLRSYYLFDAVFCQPGLRGAHEKGGVEGEVGHFRRNFLVPVPKVRDWQHLIEHCRSSMRKDLSRNIDGRQETIGEALTRERPQLLHLPDPFDSKRRLKARVDDKGRAVLLRNRYSVPVSCCGLLVEAELTSLEVVIRHQGLEVARHERLLGSGGDRLDLDHYLEVLRFKPQALANSIPLHQAKANGSFPPAYVELFGRLRQRLGESEGARQMVDILFLHRRYGAAVVFAAVNAALGSGAYDYSAVALIARGFDTPRTLTARPLPLRLLHGPEVPVPDCSQYDQLLTLED